MRVATAHAFGVAILRLQSHVMAGSRSAAAWQSRRLDAVRRFAVEASVRRPPPSSVRTNNRPVRPPLCPWSLPSAGFPRGPASGLMPAPRRHAATSVGAPGRHRSTRSCRSILRAGSSGVTRRSGPCRAPSRRNSAAISSAASSASHFGRALCTACGEGLSSRSRARGAGCAHPAMAGTWRRPRPISPITSSRRCPCDSG